MEYFSFCRAVSSALVFLSESRRVNMIVPSFMLAAQAFRSLDISIFELSSLLDKRVIVF